MSASPSCECTDNFYREKKSTIGLIKPLFPHTEVSLFYVEVCMMSLCCPLVEQWSVYTILHTGFVYSILFKLEQTPKTVVNGFKLRGVTNDKLAGWFEFGDSFSFKMF